MLNSCTASGNGNAILALNKLSLLSPPSSVYANWFWRDPLTDRYLTPGAEYASRPASPFGGPTGCTPGTSRVKSARLRPLSGRSTTRRESTTSFIVALLVSTATPEASIVTCVETSPTSSFTSTFTLSFTWSNSPVCSYFLNPDCSTVIRNSPTGSSAKRYSPTSLVTVV